MARSRYAVAILAAPDDAAEVDVLRRCVGVAEPFHVAPHLTLVPPTNVASLELGEASSVLRRAAAAAHPLQLDVGPATTFLPDTATLHLDVGGDVGALRSLRESLRSAPFDRPDEWPFSPHVTISERSDPALIRAGLTAFAGAGRRWSVESIHLLEQHRWHEGHPRSGQAFWVPIREEPLGGPIVSGRGGIEMHLRVISMVEPAVAELLGVGATVPPTVPGPVPVVLVAESPAVRGAPGPAIAAAVGSMSLGGTSAELRQLAVAEGHRGQGIGARVLSWWCRHLAERGARVVLTAPTDRLPDASVRLLEGSGFVPVGRRWIRELAGDL